MLELLLKNDNNSSHIMLLQGLDVVSLGAGKLLDIVTVRESQILSWCHTNLYIFIISM